MIDIVAINGISEWILRKCLNKKGKNQEKGSIDKVDIFNIFRVLTNKNFKHFFDVNFLDGQEKNIQSIIDQDELDRFIVEINPYFKKPYNAEKYSFYLKYFFISKVVVEKVNQLLQQRQQPFYFTIYDETNKLEINYEDIDVNSKKTGIAKLKSLHEAEDAMNLYIIPYTALGIKITIRIDSFNEINEILSTQSFSF